MNAPDGSTPRHNGAQDVSKILRRVFKLDSRNRSVAWRLREREHVPEDRGVIGEDSFENAELDVAGSEDDIPIFVPEFFIPLQHCSVPSTCRRGPLRAVGARSRIARAPLNPRSFPGGGLGHGLEI